MFGNIPRYCDRVTMGDTILKGTQVERQPNLDRTDSNLHERTLFSSLT